MVMMLTINMLSAMQTIYTSTTMILLEVWLTSALLPMVLHSMHGLLQILVGRPKFSALVAIHAVGLLPISAKKFNVSASLVAVCLRSSFGFATSYTGAFHTSIMLLVRYLHSSQD
jgi:hypothetical protein